MAICVSDAASAAKYDHIFRSNQAFEIFLVFVIYFLINIMFWVLRKILVIKSLLSEPYCNVADVVVPLLKQKPKVSSSLSDAIGKAFLFIGKIV